MGDKITTSSEAELEELEKLEPKDRIKILERKYKIVEDHTITVSKLSTKVSVLLTVMSLVFVIISGAAVYTFTSLNTFKDIYNKDLIEVYSLINDTQIKNRELINDSIDQLEESLDSRIREVERSMEKRMDDVEKQYIELRTEIKKSD